VRAGDADREPLVSKLVVLREPVERPGRQLGEDRRCDDPEQRDEGGVASPRDEQPNGARAGWLSAIALRLLVGPSGETVALLRSSVE